MSMPASFKRKMATRGRMPPIYKRKPRTAPKRRFAGRAGIQRVVSNMLKKKIETKQSTQTVVDGVEIAHNNFIILDAPSVFMSTIYSSGGDAMQGTGDRIGDEITLKYVQFRMMLELNERYSDVTFRFLVVRSAKGDAPSRSTLFSGKSGNKMLDTINNERYSIVYQKYIKLRAPNAGTTGAAQSVDLLAAGYNAWDPKLSRATRIVKFSIPGSKFGRGGLIRYENGSNSQVKFYDYTSVLYAYSNFTTLQDVFNVGRVNDYIKTMYYTDA